MRHLWIVRMLVKWFPGVCTLIAEAIKARNEDEQNRMEMKIHELKRSSQQLDEVFAEGSFTEGDRSQTWKFGYLKIPSKGIKAVVFCGASLLEPSEGYLFHRTGKLKQSSVDRLCCEVREGRWVHTTL